MRSNSPKNDFSTGKRIQTTVTEKAKSLGKSNPESPGEIRGFCPLLTTTGCDFMGVYLHWPGLAADEACPFCSHARMDGMHLLQSTGLDEYPTDDIVSRYWKARRQMVKKPSMDIG
ncbi:reverse transcriptase [Trichonephila clavipes]|nr:reverse transcriptase [Trichonephila clavipes]